MTTNMSKISDQNSAKFASDIIKNTDKVHQEDSAQPRFSKLRERSLLSPSTLGKAQDQNAEPLEPITPWLQELLGELDIEARDTKEAPKPADAVSTGTDTFADTHGEINETNSQWFSMLLHEVRKSLAKEMQGWGQNTESAADETVKVFRNECATGRIEGLQKAAKKNNKQRKASISRGNNNVSSSSPSQMHQKSDINLSKKFRNASAKLYEFSPASDISPILENDHSHYATSSHSSDLQNLLLRRRSRMSRKDALKREQASERRSANLFLKAAKLRDENHWKYIRGLIAIDGRKHMEDQKASAATSSAPRARHATLSRSGLKANENFEMIVNSDENAEPVIRPRGFGSESSKNFSTMATSGGEDFEEEDANFLSPLPNYASHKAYKGVVKGVNDSQYDGDASSAAPDHPPREHGSLLVYPSPTSQIRAPEDLTLMPVWYNKVNTSSQSRFISDEDNKRSLPEFAQEDGDDGAGLQEEGMCVVDMASPKEGMRNEQLVQDDDEWNEAGPTNDFDFDEEHIRAKIRDHHKARCLPNYADEDSFDEDEEAEKMYQEQLHQLRLVQQRQVLAQEDEAEMRTSQRASGAMTKPFEAKNEHEIYKAINKELRDAVHKLEIVPGAPLDKDNNNYEDFNYESGAFADDEETDANQGVPDDEYIHSNNTYNEQINELRELDNDASSASAYSPLRGFVNDENAIGEEDIFDGDDQAAEQEPRVFVAYMLEDNETRPHLARTPPATSVVMSGDSSTDITDEMNRMNGLNSKIEKRVMKRNYSSNTGRQIKVPALECLTVHEDGTIDDQNDALSLAPKLLRRDDHHHRHGTAVAVPTLEPLYIIESGRNDNESNEILTPNELQEQKNDDGNSEADAAVSGRAVESHSSIPDAKLPAMVPQARMSGIQNQSSRSISIPTQSRSGGAAIKQQDPHPSAATADWLLIGTSHFPHSFAKLSELSAFFDDSRESETLDMLVIDPFEALHHRRKTLIKNTDSLRQSLAVERGRELLAAKVLRLKNTHHTHACSSKFGKELRAMAVIKNLPEPGYVDPMAGVAPEDDQGEYLEGAQDREWQILNADMAEPETIASPQQQRDQQLHNASGSGDEEPASSWLTRAIAAVKAVKHAFSNNDHRDASPSPLDDDSNLKPRKSAGICLDFSEDKTDSNRIFSSAAIGKHFSHTRARIFAQQRQWEAAASLPPIKQSLSVKIDGEEQEDARRDQQMESENNSSSARNHSKDDFGFLFDHQESNSEFGGALAYGKTLSKINQKFRSRVIVTADTNRHLVATQVRHSILRDRARSLKMKEESTFQHIADANKEHDLDSKIDREVNLLDIKMASYRREQALEKRKEALKKDRYRQLRATEVKKMNAIKKNLKREEQLQRMADATARRKAFLRARVNRLAALDNVRQQRTISNGLKRDMAFSSGSE